MNDAHAQSAANTPASSAGTSPTSSASASPDTSQHLAAARCECPRCGYDLSGAVAAWNHAESTSCPMRGTCSECGLEFAWGELLGPELIVPGWSFEQARRLLPLKLLLTISVALWPFKLWRELRMVHVVRARRLVVLVIVGVPLVHALLVIMPLAASLANNAVLATPASAGWTDEFEIVIQSAWPYSDSISAYVLQSGYRRWGIPTIVRPWAVLVWLWWLLMMPSFFLLPTTLRRCRILKSHLFRVGAYSLIFAAGAVQLLTCTTRSMSSGLRELVVWHSRAGYGIDLDTYFAILRWFYRGSVWAAPLLCALVLSIYWGLAASRYLKLPRAWLVSGILTIVAGLAATLLLWLWPGMLARLYLHVWDHA